MKCGTNQNILRRESPSIQPTFDIGEVPVNNRGRGGRGRGNRTRGAGASAQPPPVGVPPPQVCTPSLQFWTVSSQLCTPQPF